MKKQAKTILIKANFHEKPRYSQYLKSLQLDLCVDGWVKHLSERDSKILYKLSLAYCQINSLNFPNLFQYDWKNLKILLLSFNSIGSSGVKFLIKIDLPSLEQMSLRRCMIGNQGAKHITKTNWPNIKKLSVRNNCLELDGYISISQNCWNKMQMLEMEQYKQVIYSFNDYIAVANLIVLQPCNNRVSKVFSNFQFQYGMTKLQKARSMHYPYDTYDGPHYIRT